MDFVVASHVIEHVPALITWLQEVRSILKPQGQVRLMIPDRRYTFDYLRAESRISDVINSYLHRARMPLSNCILDFLLNMGPVNCKEAWDGTLDLTSFKKGYTLEQALNIARDAIENKVYHDVHCWVFTPRSFAMLMGELVSMGFIDFGCERFSDSEQYTNEFFVSMQSFGHKDDMRKSWQDMAAAVGSHELKSDVRLRANAARLEEALAASEARANSALREVEALKLALAAERAQLVQLRGSRSWRVTQPMRALAETVRGGSRAPTVSQKV